MKALKWEERTIGNLLEQRAKAYREKPYLLCEDLKVTYGEMDENVNRVANSLLAVGVKKGDKVCMIMGNSPNFLYTWFAVAKIGAVMVPINTALKGDLLSYIIENSDGSALVVDKNLVDRVLFIRKRIKKVKTIIIVGEEPDGTTGFGTAFDVRNFRELLGGSPGKPDRDACFYDPLCILYTSGTTGASKGAVLSHAHFYSLTIEITRYMGYDEKTIAYSCHPLFHANAMFFGALGAMVAGGTFAMAKRFSLATFWNEIKAYGATHTSVVGSVFPLLCRQPPRADDAQNPLKVLITVPWLPEFEEFEKRFGVRLVTGYGATETGTVCATPMDEKIRPGSCGKAVPIYDVRIFDDHDLEVPARTIGEIVVRGNQPYAQMDFYYKNPEATVNVFRNLWLHTGDYGYVDEDGYFYFVDRKKDALRRRGENISSFEVEKVINSHPKVQESSVFAVRSDMSEDEVMAVVILKPGEKMDPEELIAYCEERMAYFAVPRYLDFREVVPRTPTLRVEKYKLREEGVTGSTWDREKAGYKLKR